MTRKKAAAPTSRLGYRTTAEAGLRTSYDPAAGPAAGWVVISHVGLPWTVRVRLEEVGGVPEMTGLHLERRGPTPWIAPNGRPLPPATPGEAAISARSLRRLPLAMLREAAARTVAGELTEVRRLARSQRDQRPAGQPWPAEHYEEVARVYAEAVRRRLPPLKAIQARWHVSRPMASKYVKRAREEGLLAWPERRGVPGPAGPATTETPPQKGS